MVPGLWWLLESQRVLPTGSRVTALAKGHPQPHGSADIPPPSHRSPEPRSRTRTACDVSGPPLSLRQQPGLWGDVGGHWQCPHPGGSQLGAQQGAVTPGNAICGWRGGATAAGTNATLLLSPQLLSAPGWSVDGRRAAPEPLGAGGSAVGQPRGTGPGWAATRLAWPERRAGVTDNRARRQPSSHRQ